MLVNLDFPTIEPDSDALPGEKIRYYREKKGVSKEELADFLGITVYGLINLEKGFNPVYYKDAVLIGKYLEVEPEAFMDEYAVFCKQGYGKKIKAIRNAFGVSQNDFADMVGVDRSTVSIWEAELNERHPNRKLYIVLKSMAEEKGVNLGDT